MTAIAICRRKDASAFGRFEINFDDGTTGDSGVIECDS